MISLFDSILHLNSFLPRFSLSLSEVSLKKGDLWSTGVRVRRAFSPPFIDQASKKANFLRCSHHNEKQQFQWKLFNDKILQQKNCLKNPTWRGTINTSFENDILHSRTKTTIMILVLRYYRVYQRFQLPFKLNLGKRSEMFIFRSFLATFEVSSIF